LADHRQALARDGTLVLVGGGIGRDTGGSQTLTTLRTLAVVVGRAPFSRVLRQRIRMFVARMRTEDLAQLAELCEAGRVTPVVERAYPLADAAEAIRHLENGHVRGKLVVVT
jgi:NADPH:quinone reductase-like Zn-dependent oxidoreductase